MCGPSFPFLSCPLSFSAGWIPGLAEEIMQQYPIFRHPPPHLIIQIPTLHSAALRSVQSITDLVTCVLSYILLDLIVVACVLVSISSVILNTLCAVVSSYCEMNTFLWMFFSVIMRLYSRSCYSETQNDHNKGINEKIPPTNGNIWKKRKFLESDSCVPCRKNLP